jgi:hypothetical protein
MTETENEAHCVRCRVATAASSAAGALAIAWAAEFPIYFRHTTS